MSSLLTRSALPRVIARTALIRPLATTYRFPSAKQSGIMSEATNVYTKEAPFRENEPHLICTIEPSS
jgi:hypothetical protein